MHEESVGNVIRDYLTGEEIEETSYEEFRQALAKMLVEERGFPKERLKAKIGICFPMEGREYTRMADIAAYAEDGSPMLLAVFCSGEPGSYIRETLAAARLHKDVPAPFALVTDTKEAILLDASDGSVRGLGMRAVPHWEELRDMVAASPAAPLPDDVIERERRILFTYSEFLQDGCCHAFCRPKALD